MAKGSREMNPRITKGTWITLVLVAVAEYGTNNPTVASSSSFHHHETNKYPVSSDVGICHSTLGLNGPGLRLHNGVKG